MRYHFIGICGAGMSAVAKLLIEQGHTVTGSDEGFYPPVSDYLQQHSIPCIQGHNEKNIPTDVDYVVIGKHAKLTPEENSEVAAAFSSGKTILSFPQVLEKITNNKERFVVAGSYGKSTCTSLVSWCLTSNDIDAGYFIGAVPITPTTNAHNGKGKEFVLEGDEYPSSNWDTTSKFLFYHPQHTLITALSHDHVNVFPTHEDYLTPFKKLIEETSASGKLVLCHDDETVQKLLPTISREIVTYGIETPSQYMATDIVYGNETTFTLTCNNEEIIKLNTSLLGKHNVENIVGVAALLLETKKITPVQLQQSIKTFKGIIRRLDKKSEKTIIPIYEGFGSSFDKATSAIDAIKLHFPDKKLCIIFEPHTFSWRNRNALHWYDTVFNQASSVYVYKPPLHGSASHDQLTHEEIIARIQKANISAKPFSSQEEGLSLVSEEITKESSILILSSGSMDGFIPHLVQYLEKTFPNH